MSKIKRDSIPLDMIDERLKINLDNLAGVKRAPIDDPIMDKFQKKLKQMKELKVPEKNDTEKQVKQKVVAYLKKKGWEVFTVYLGGIPTGGGMLATNPLKGFPDLICTHSTLKSMIFIELKRTKGGKLSDPQILWAHRLQRCNQRWLSVTSIDDCKKAGL
jgi:VRR-NUC domain-containing protein